MLNRILAVVLLLLIGPVQAVTFKIATIAPDGTVWMEEMRRGAAEIKARTEERVKFRFFPGGVMGNDKSVLRKIRIGQLHGGAIVSGGLAAIYPDIEIYTLPFAFRSLDEVDYVRERMDADLVKGLDDNGFVSFGISEGGFAYLLSNQPIAAVEDFKGQKVWVPQGDRISYAALKSIGISPISLAVSDVLTGLQTGLVDTVASSPIGTIALQWHTRVKYLMTEPLAYIYATLVIQKKKFQRLSLSDQAIVHEVMEAIFIRLNRLNREDNVAAWQALQEQGIEFVKPSAQALVQWLSIKESAEQRLRSDGVLSVTALQTLQSHLDTYRRNRVAVNVATP